MDNSLCEHHIDHTCGLVASLAGLDRSLCVVSEDACTACLASAKPRQRNQVTASLAIAAAIRSLPPAEAQRVRTTLNSDIRIEKPADSRESGPGTELKKILAWLGFKEYTGCQCRSRQRQMDMRGADWCEANLATICDWLREEAEKQSIPFFEFAGKAMIRLAIKRARSHADQAST